MGGKRRKNRFVPVRTKHPSEHLANREGVVMPWAEKNTGLSALLTRIRQRSAVAKRSRMLSSQLRRDRAQRNKSGVLD